MYPKSWKRQTVEAATLLLVLAWVAHLAWTWLRVLLPSLIALLVLTAVYVLIMGRTRR